MRAQPLRLERAYGNAEFAAETLEGAGSFSISPLSSRGEVSVNAVDLKKYLPYAENFFRGKIVGGKLAVRVPYRVAQEALNNVLKHSGASEAAVSLDCRADSALLSISDNGAGFDPETVSPKHLGLRIMQERAEAVKAALKVTSSVGHGTKITVFWSDASRTSRRWPTRLAFDTETLGDAIQLIEGFLA